VRTTNLLERLFGENRRRTKGIPPFFQEGAAMKLIYATLVPASQKWRGSDSTGATPWDPWAGKIGLDQPAFS
jgi:transposase-like protein